MNCTKWIAPIIVMLIFNFDVVDAGRWTARALKKNLGGISYRICSLVHASKMKHMLIVCIGAAATAKKINQQPL